MRFDIITIFPEIFDFYFKHSILKRAQDKKIIKIKVHNLRDFTSDKRKTVDDKPFGGGRGMVLKIEPLYRAVQSLKAKSKKQKAKFRSKIILFTPRGKKFNQKMATQFSKLDQLIMIAGRYEGVDERVAKYVANEAISMGGYVGMSGDLPALTIVEAVARLVPGVVGKSENLIEERITKSKGFREYPQYTRPEAFKIGDKIRKVPKVLLSGNHKEIEEWRQKHSKIIE